MLDRNIEHVVYPCYYDDCNNIQMSVNAGAIVRVYGYGRGTIATAGVD